MSLPEPVSAALCAVLALAIAWVTRGVVAAWLRDDERRLESRRRLKRAAWCGGIAALVSLLPLLVALRGATDEVLDLAIPASMVCVTLALSFVGACFLELREEYGQVIAHAYHAAVHAIERQRLLSEELGRILEGHPFAGRNGGGGRSAGSRVAMSAVLIAFLLPGAARAATFRAVHVVVDTTGSLHRPTLRATLDAIASSLPALARGFDLDRIEVSGWGTASTWAPPASAFSMSRPTSDEPDTNRTSALERYFGSIAEARAKRRARDRRAAVAITDSLRHILIDRDCLEPAALLRTLAEAGRHPEPGCTPVEAMLARCALEPANRLTILVTDAVGCGSELAVPPIADSRTIIVLIPSTNRGQENNVMRALEQLQARWLTVIPASALDSAGAWVGNVSALEAHHDDIVSAGGP